MTTYSTLCPGTLIHWLPERENLGTSRSDRDTGDRCRPMTMPPPQAPPLVGRRAIWPHSQAIAVTARRYVRQALFRPWHCTQAAGDSDNGPTVTPLRVLTCKLCDGLAEQTTPRSGLGVDQCGVGQLRLLTRDYGQSGVVIRIIVSHTSSNILMSMGSRRSRDMRSSDSV